MGLHEGLQLIAKLAKRYLGGAVAADGTHERLRRIGADHFAQR